MRIVDSGPSARKSARRHDPLARHVGAVGGHREQVVEVPVGTEVLRVASRVGAVCVQQRDVELECGHREVLVVAVRRRDHLEVGVDLRDRGTETGAAREEVDTASPRRAGPTGACLRRAPSPRWCRSGARRGSAARGRSSRATRSRTRPCAALPAAHSIPTSGPPYATTVRSVRSERRIARTIDIGLRREPHPAMPMVMPSRSSATTSSSVMRLSVTQFPICSWATAIKVGRRQTLGARRRRRV